MQSKVSNTGVPIELRKVNIPLTPDKKVVGKRKHFPLVAACAITIRKSQGETYDEIVFEYSKGDSQELVYDGLFIVTAEDDQTKFRFYHNRVQAKSTDRLLQGFKRLSLHSLETKHKWS